MANLQSFIDAYDPAIEKILAGLVISALMIGIVKIFITLSKRPKNFF